MAGEDTLPCPYQSTRCISYFTGHVRRSDPGPVHAWQGGGAGGSQEEQPHVVAYKVNIIGNYEHNTRKTYIYIANYKIKSL